MNTIKNKVLSFLGSIVFSFKISFKASPAIMCLRLITILVSSIVPFVNAEAIKNIINYIVTLDVSYVWFWFAILAVTQLLTAVLAKVTSYLSLIHNDKITLYISTTIIDKINKLSINYFDNTELYNEVKNVSRDANSIPNLTWNLLTLVKSMVQFISAFTILLYVSWWAPLIVVVSCLPNFLFEKYYSMKMYEWSRTSTNDVRKINYLYSTLNERYFSKDIRVNQLNKSLKNQYINKWCAWFKQKLSINKRQFLSTFITMFLPHTITLLFTAFIIYQSINNNFKVGDITYYISIMGQLTAATFAVIAQVSTTIKSQKKIEYYKDFLMWEEAECLENNIEITDIDEIRFESVYFKYPGNDEYALKDVSLCIRKGEKIAFIGKNGSGKSTIVKLILGLYTPTKGTIYINGIDIRKININCIYNLSNVMFQDYINYSFSLRENLESVDIGTDYTDDELYSACKKGNSYNFVQSWKNGLDTYLTRSFDMGGQELSGGQWQRLSLSRTFVKEATLFIYDEPAASLDIEAENLLYKELIYNHKNSTLLLISHRMSYMKNMDKIIVMDSGRIIENGDHNQLLRQDGIYADLYNLKIEGE